MKPAATCTAAQAPWPRTTLLIPLLSQHIARALLRIPPAALLRLATLQLLGRPVLLRCAQAGRLAALWQAEALHKGPAGASEPRHSPCQGPLSLIFYPALRPCPCLCPCPSALAPAPVPALARPALAPAPPSPGIPPTAPAPAPALTLMSSTGK